jgi:hypothetical protein
MSLMSEDLLPIADYAKIGAPLRGLYLVDDRPWLVGFSGGKDGTMIASLAFDTVLAVPQERCRKPIARIFIHVRQAGAARGASRSLRRERAAGESPTVPSVWA